MAYWVINRIVDDCCGLSCGLYVYRLFYRGWLAAYSYFVPLSFDIGNTRNNLEPSSRATFVGNAPLAWIGTHIAVSVVTYALLTLAAIAALAATLQERAIKAKKRTRMSGLLPSVAGSEGLFVRLLLASEVILAIGLITGMATLYMTTGQFLTFDHKTTLTLIVFVIIGVILFVHFRTGIRGRLATRIVLLAYLLLTLGYPGVKFVTDILLSS